MASTTAFSLFPAAKQQNTNGGGYNVPALTSRESMLEFTRSSWLDSRSNYSENEMEARSAGPAQKPSLSSITIQQGSIASKSQTSLSSTGRPPDPGETSPPQPNDPDRPFSPESFLQRSERSSSPTLVASYRNSVSTMRSRKKPPPPGITTDSQAQIRSMFPTYDPERSLDQQFYLPTQTSPNNIPWEQVCKAPYSPDFDPPKSDSSTKGLLFTAPTTTSNEFTPEIELPSLWELSQGRANTEARSQTYRLQMHRNLPGSKKSRTSKRKSVVLEPIMTFGPSTATPFFSVFSEPCTQEVQKGTEKTMDRVRIRKHNLSRFDSTRDQYADSSILVSDMMMDPRESSKPSKTAENPENIPTGNISNITPHKAILDSLSIAGTSSAAADLATVDPGASSIAAAHLAEQAMSLARRKHTCKLAFSTVPELRLRGYSIRHPSLGYFQVVVEGDIRLSDSTSKSDEPSEPPNKKPPPARKPGSIRLLAPVSEKIPPLYGVSTNSQNAFKNQSKVLASLDLASSTLTLDGAALTELNDRYMVDTAVSTLVAVLLAETACPRISHLTSFAPPPTKAMAKAALKGVPKYKYFPLIKTKKEPKVSKVDKTAEEMEQGLAVAFGAMVFVLGAAVDGLGTAVDRVKANNSRL